MSCNEVVGRGTDAESPPDFVDGTAHIGLFQDRNDLRLGELPLAHGNLLAKGVFCARTFSLRPVYFLGELTLFLHL